MAKDDKHRQLKFYGLNDYMTFFNVQQAMELLDAYDENKADYAFGEILALYNALQFIEQGVFPKNFDKSKRASCLSLVPKIKKTMSIFFNAITDSNVGTIITDIDPQYRQDTLSLLTATAHKVYERVPAATLLPVLKSAGISMGNILANKTLVTAYDADVCALFIADPKNAEHLIYKYLEATDRREVHLPPSLTAADMHTLIESYIDSNDANPNYIKLVADSRINKTAGIDAKLKLKAKRKHDTWNDEFFKSNPGGMSVGCEVRVSNEQEEPLKLIQEGTTTIYSYSRKWLEEHATPAEIVNIFINLFAFVHEGMILSLPAYKAELGVFERFMGVKGKEIYPAGVAFQFREQSAFLQTMMYEKFLRNRDRQLEDVIEWFFGDYLKERFKAKGFRYVPSSKLSTYLEKSRHVFTEMESVIKQFSLYAENGKIDKDLLAITSEQVRYHSIPSQIADKYAYATDSDEIAGIQHYLFSDQSGLTYIDETLSANSLFELLVSKEIEYDTFHDYQKPQIDKLINFNVLEKVGALVRFRSEDQMAVLKTLSDVEALSYHHNPTGMRTEIDEMVNKGWLARKTSLFTEPEASYFNYFLNQQEFSDGYDLRNKYLHGSQADKDNENAHYTTYIIALMLMMALVIKISSDFLLKDSVPK